MDLVFSYAAHCTVVVRNSYIKQISVKYFLGSRYLYLIKLGLQKYTWRDYGFMEFIDVF